MLRKDQTKEQLLYLWPVVSNSESFWAWMNTIWVSLLIHGRVVQQLIQPELVIVLKDVSSLQILSLPTIIPGNTATLAHFIKNPSWGRLRANQVNTGEGHHPWASQPVQLRKYLQYQGSRHHLQPVAYTLNYPLHRLSDEVLPALHSHIKRCCTHPFQLDRISDCFASVSTKKQTSLLQAFLSLRKHHWSKGGQREILSC